MLFLLDKDVRTVKWNGIPLHETSSAIVKEEVNGDFILTVRYPITDSGVYQLIREDMLIKAPAPVLGAQLFRIKKPIENDDSLDITAYHVSDDIMKRSITPVSVVGQGCAMALSQMVQNAKTGLGDFSFTSDIMDSRTFNTTETETLYSVLMDGKHSIVGTWEGELVRDNFALSIKRSRGADRGVVITTHKNLKSYQRTKNSQGVVTRIHARSTFKPDGAEDEVTLRVTVDSPLINSYPYINEKEYENNNAETVEDLKKWAEAKFKHEGIDKVLDAIEIEAYELDGQVVHMGDIVNIKSRKHGVDIYKKAIAYEFNALTEEYISITFDDKSGVGGSGVSSGLSNAADAILGASVTAQDVAIQRAVKNANQAFEAEFEKNKQAIEDGIEEAKAAAEVVKAEVSQAVSAAETKANQALAGLQDSNQRSTEALNRAGVSSNLAETARQLAAEAKANLGNLRSQVDAQARELGTKLTHDEVMQRVGTALNGYVPNSTFELYQTQSAQALTTWQRETREMIPSKIDTVNLVRNSKISESSSTYGFGARTVYLEAGKKYWFVARAKKTGGTPDKVTRIYLYPPNWSWAVNLEFTQASYEIKFVPFYAQSTGTHEIMSYWFPSGGDRSGTADVDWYMVVESDIAPQHWSPHPDDLAGKTDLVNYVQTSTFDRYQRETAQTIERGLTETRGLIPTELGGVNYFKHHLPLEHTVSKFNPVSTMVKNDKFGFDIITPNLNNTVYRLNGVIKTNGFWTVSFWAQSVGPARLAVDICDRGLQELTIVPELKKYSVTALVDNWTESDHHFVDFTQLSTDWLTIQKVKVERGKIATDHSVHPDSLVTTVDFNHVKETAQLYERVLGRTEGDVATNIARQVMTSELMQHEIRKIPTTIGGTNLLVNSTFTEDTQHWIINGSAQRLTTPYPHHQFNGRFGTTLFALQDITDKVKNDADNQVYTYNLEVKVENMVHGRTDPFTHIYIDGYHGNRWFGAEHSLNSDLMVYNNKGWQKMVGRFTLPTRTGMTQCNFVIFCRDFTGSVSFRNVKLERGTVATDYSPAPEELATATRVTQLANSYAISLLRGDSDVLSAITVATGGIGMTAGNNKLVVTPDTTFIQDGTIKNAMIETLHGGKIMAGSITSTTLAAEAITADKLKVDQALFNKLMANEAYLRQLFAKQAFITQVQAVTISADQIQGGVLSAINGAVRFNLNQAQLDFNSNATINFNAANNALVRKRGTHTGFVHFADERNGGVYASIGVTSSGDGINSSSSGRFAGIRIFRTARGGMYSTVHEAAVDQTEIYADNILLKDGFDGQRGYVFAPDKLAGYVNMNELTNAVKALAQCFFHLRANGWDWAMPNLRTAIGQEMDNYMAAIVPGQRHRT